MKYDDAMALAMRLKSDLVGRCERIEIAGSLRREKPDVKDIELVLIPTFTEREVAQFQASMFDPAKLETVNVTQEEIRALDYVQVIKPGTQEIIPWHLNASGKYWRLYLPEEDMKVDVFACTPETWGLNYMIRTGAGIGPSGEAYDGFGPGMLTRWKQVSGGGYSLESQLRTPAGATIRTPEEADVFEACRVAFVPPWERISSRDVERYAL